MENFFYDNEYYDSIEDLIYKLVDSEDEIYELDDDFEIKCYPAKLEPLQEIDEYWLLERMDEDRFPENDERTDDEILKILRENIDFKKINEAMPKLWYESYPPFILRKEDLIDYIK